MKIPEVSEIDVLNKNVLVRVSLEGDMDSPRLLATKNIIQYLQSKQAGRIKIIGHKGNIGQTELGVDINWDLRADAREETNDESFARELALGFEVFVNESFETSHRNHTSIVALPKFFKSHGFPAVVGPRFTKEIEILTKVFGHPGKKVLVIGGAKAGDKAQYADNLQSKFDVVLRGGLLPGVKLTADGLDIADEAIEACEQQIQDASLVVVAGPMGKYEEVPKGTQEVFTAVANSKSFKIAGGGDTEAALEKFGLTKKFDWISVGGGAMLEFLDKGTLPGIEALIA